MTSTNSSIIGSNQDHNTNNGSSAILNIRQTDDDDMNARFESITLCPAAINAPNQELNICKICMDNQIAIVFLPCGHLISCVSCSIALSKCPLCRERIRGTVKSYLS